MRRGAEVRTSILTALAAPNFCQVLAVCMVFYSLATQFVRQLVGWPGSLGILATLLALGTGSLIGQWPRVERHGILPFSLIAFFAWMLLSATWSDYGWVSLGSALYAISFAGLAVYLALGRDLIQVLRAVGDGLRAILAISLGLEMFSAFVVRRPLGYLGISGSLADGGPIDGIAGTRNYLGFLACLALITFIVEWRTHSVERVWAAVSTSAALVTLAFVRSPVTLVVLVSVAVASVAVYGLRRVPARRRPVAQVIVGVVVAIGIAVAWVVRSPLVALLRATSDFDSRAGLWSRTLQVASVHALQGWGWTGIWRSDQFPYDYLDDNAGKTFDSALNAGIDAYLQIGIVGFLLLAGAVLLAAARAWLVGTENPSTLFAWPALTLVLIVVTDLAQSYILFEGTLMLFVCCAIAAARKRSWRRRLDRPLEESVERE